MDKNELIVLALQQRIGELVSMYEIQIASLRAEITNFINDQKNKEDEAIKYSNEIAAKLSD
jgi:hypothetical protein